MGIFYLSIIILFVNNQVLNSAKQLVGTVLITSLL